MKKVAGAVLILLLLAAALWYGQRAASRGRQGSAPATPETPPMSLPVVSTPTVHPTQPSKPTVKPVASVAPSVTPSSASAKGLLPKQPTETPTFVIPEGQEGMARHLIPRGITIVGMRFQEEVVAPGMTFSFDVNGTGFDDTFYRMISIDADTLDIEIKNLQLVTANQIHGQISVGDAALTGWVKPLIYIRGNPVFHAIDPFGVVRRGEVLDIQLTSIDESGQWGQFRMITNMDTSMFNALKITPTTPKLEVGNVKPRLPFYVDGVIQIGEMLSAGSYGLVVSMGPRTLLKKVPLVDVVKPSVGKTGSIEDVKVATPAQRPGDRTTFVVRGSGFMPRDASSVLIEAPGLAVIAATVTYFSTGRMQAQFTIPNDAAVRVYGIRMTSVSGKTLFEKKSVFVVVPPNWLSGIKLSMPLKPGASSTIALTGRDISPEYVGGLRFEVDEPGLKVSPPRRQDATTVMADIQAQAHVAPGDYLIHVYSGDKEIKLPAGNLIQVSP